MPRNGAGTFSIINPVVVGALRSSSAVNQNFTDAGDEITNSLPINGEAGMSGQFKAIDGSALVPGMAFSADTNVGFRRSATDEMKWVAGGSDRATMDANGKLTLAGGLEVSGALSHNTGAFGPQTLAGTGAARATLRRTENDTDEHELATYESGSGSGAKGSLRVVGGGSNDVATMRFYVNDVLTFQWTGTLFTHSVDTLFGASGIRADTDGFLDFPEVTAPSAPTANTARAYARDDSGTTRLYYKDGSGNERNFQPPVDQQTFTSSGTWTKPTAGQTIAKIEAWGGGGGCGSGGGGGGGYSVIVITISSLSNNVSVTVGSGGNDTGTDGGNSTFGSYLTAYGGGGSSSSGGGGGGGVAGKGGNVTSTVSAGDGGLYNGILGSATWGDEGDPPNCNPFGGGGGGNSSSSSGVDGQISLFGGGGGGGWALGSGNGGASIFGGGGGAGQSFGGSASGGISIFGGNGGSNGDGTPPGGGGGAVFGANGARGEVRITCW